MRLDEFNFRLPPELIAQQPLESRDDSRLLVVHRKTGTLEHRMFRELPSLLKLGDRLVVNDTRVIKARLFGHRIGGTGRVEILLHRPVPESGDHPTYEALARPAKKIRVGSRLMLGERRVPVEVIEELDERTRVVQFPSGFPLAEFLENEGHIPLPPYIAREDDDADGERYQTVFAAHPGAVAAPTAGLHFSEAVLTELGAAGVARSAVTLNVGLGTFSPVTVDEIEDHVMDREWYRVSSEAAEKITSTRARGGRVVAVGTTVVRTLESAALDVPEFRVWGVQAGEAWTKIFIRPPFTFRVVDALVTNFHLPRSTLLMLVSTFAGLELMREAYAAAVEEKYRFYSYGDAMLIL